MGFQSKAAVKYKRVEVGFNGAHSNPFAVLGLVRGVEVCTTIKHVAARLGCRTGLV